jgi:hypothetical protein
MDPLTISRSIANTRGTQREARQLNKPGLMAFLACLTTAILGWSQSVALLPVETIGFPAGLGALFDPACSTDLAKNGYRVVDGPAITAILAAQAVSPSGAVNGAADRLKVAGAAQTRYVLALSLLWNGAYTLVDLRFDDAQNANLSIRRCYTTLAAPELLASKGIPEIIAALRAGGAPSSLWILGRDYRLDSYPESLKKWSRSLGATRICLLYAAPDSLQAVRGLPRSGGADTAAVKEEVFKTYDALNLSGEFVFQYALGAYKSVMKYGSLDCDVCTGQPAAIYAGDDEEEYQVNYDIAKTLLGDPRTVVAFMGTTEESSLAENWLDKEQAGRFLRAKIWK